YPVIRVFVTATSRRIVRSLSTKMRRGRDGSTAMFKHLVPVLAELALLAVGACVPSASVRAPAVSNDDPAVGDGLRQLRSATAAYKHFDVAVAAGYAPTAVCIIDEHHGAMGYHHLN